MWTSQLLRKDGKLVPYMRAGPDWRALTKWHFLFFVKTYGIRGPIIEFKAPRPAIRAGALGGVEGDDERPAGEGTPLAASAPAAAVSTADAAAGEVTASPPHKKGPMGSQGSMQPPWLKIVVLERHARFMELQEMEKSVFAFSTGLPYGAVRGGVTRKGCFAQ